MCVCACFNTLINTGTTDKRTFVVAVLFRGVRNVKKKQNKETAVKNWEGFYINTLSAASQSNKKNNCPALTPGANSPQGT